MKSFSLFRESKGVSSRSDSKYTLVRSRDNIIIALAAGTSTGSIYTRFHNKVGLFHAIVAPVVDEIRSW
ncbi:TetR/AcrR family transcriptional regulator [Clostridium estertheticum]|uniref:TetR/AcrR family transcriptional regulator n=1 Tax=Clostridium estertheticum TaxID=238834 RepID=A0A5N7IIT9_9CLOT|nr:TetR/AcrR family transcriptional regulator [Clostridium estertheticum]MPQ60857.1 TetR/AcrR family transcriptional regulator [Clostridium estertheticum]